MPTIAPAPRRFSPSRLRNPPSLPSNRSPRPSPPRGRIPSSPAPDPVEPEGLIEDLKDVEAILKCKDDRIGGHR